ERVLIVLLIANIVLNITAQVISRYAYGLPLVWVEEVATYSFIWATFIGASLGLKYDRHVKIETFVGRLPPRAAAVFKALVMALILALLVGMMPRAWVNMTLEMRRMTIALPVMVPMGWFFSVPLLVGMASMALTALYRLLVELTVAAGGPPPPPIGGYAAEVEEDVEVERVLAGERA
ncbi:MAG TPA: TRAP transporter small permease subunit, partial [Geminicoccaceae bacterium]|nr:TRAP transporter small permease subunit [Geminicoccaceae bacterium]